MAEKLTDEQVDDLLTILRGDSALDAKVQFVNNIKSGIKQHNVPETCIPQLFDGLRAASSSQHAALVNAGFTALNHLITRISRQDPKILVKEAPRTLPLVIEKLGDQKDKLRSIADQALTTMYGPAASDVERTVRNSAMTGKNPRAKEAAMHWLLKTHQELGLPFRGYVPLLMDLLEDADGMVRDTAKTTVIELFKDAPNTAKSDLKRQLKNFKVRPAIEQAIVKALAPAGGRPETPSDAVATTAAPAPAPAPAPTRPANLAASVGALPSERPVTPMVDAPAETVEPMYVNTIRELDDIIKDMAWQFEGKESEQNWFKREQSMTTLRRVNAANAATDFRDTFIAGLRGMLDGIIKTINSLRTSLSKEGCALVQELAVSLGPGLDGMVELLMQTLIKLAGGTKKIASQMGNATVDIILSNVTYNNRLMQHVWGACQDKNVQPRLYSTGWIKTILKKESHHKAHIEHTGGTDLMEKCIKKGLGDANPAVREKTRGTYWAFWAVWPAKGDALMENLEPTAQKLLKKDPANPNSPKKAEATQPTKGLSASSRTASKPSLRETMLAQKRAAMAAKNMPTRPGSAMSHFSPAKTERLPSNPTQPSILSSHTTHSTVPTKPAATKARGEPAVSVKTGGMSVAPMRPVRRRPEVVVAARPATAGPYSVRDQPLSMEIDSPETLKSKGASSKFKETTPRRPIAPRGRPGHAPHASESNLASPIGPSTRKAASSPRVTPARLRPTQTHIPGPSPPRDSEDISLVVPSIASLKLDSPKATHAPKFPPSRPIMPEETHNSPRHASPAHHILHHGVQPHTVSESTLDAQVESPSRTLKVFEDPFTDQQQPAPKPTISVPVLEEKTVNEDVGSLQKNVPPPTSDEMDSPEKVRQNSRLLDSGITKIKSKSLEVHGFRKLQSLIRDSKTVFTDERFEALLVGLFHYLEDPLADVPSDRAQDVKAQILATIKLLLKKERDNFQPHVSKGLESLLQTRGAYDTRAHVVSGLELLADELVTIGDGSEIVVVLTKRLQTWPDTTTEGCRTLSMGLHVLKEMLDRRTEFIPTQTELTRLTTLAGRCLDSADSGVRMDAVKFCVALHSRVGEASFWGALQGVKDDPKSLITYYIVKRQREQGIATTPV